MNGLQKVFGNRLRQAREEKALSRESLVNALVKETEGRSQDGKETIDIDPLTLRNWELGYRWPREPKTIEAIGKILGKPWSYFFQPEEQEPTLQEAWRIVSKAIETISTIPPAALNMLHDIDWGHKEAGPWLQAGAQGFPKKAHTLKKRGSV